MARTYFLFCALVALKLPFNILILQKFHTDYTDQSTSPKLSLNLHNNDQTYFRFANIFYAFTFFDYYEVFRSDFDEPRVGFRRRSPAYLSSMLTCSPHAEFFNCAFGFIFENVFA